MNDYISREEALKCSIYAPIAHLSVAPLLGGNHVHYEQIIMESDIKSLPSVELEIPKGKWIKFGDDGGYCSECNSDMPIFMEDWKYKSCETKFCPNCGAKMEVSDECKAESKEAEERK